MYCFLLPNRHLSHVLVVLLFVVVASHGFFIVRRVCIDPRLLGAIRFVSVDDDSSQNDGMSIGGVGSGSGGTRHDRGRYHYHRHNSEDTNSDVMMHNSDGENHRKGLTHKHGNITRLDSWPGHGSKGSNTESTTEAGDDIEKFLVGRRRRRRRRRRAALWAHPALYNNPVIGEQLSFTPLHHDTNSGPTMDDVPEFNDDNRQRRKLMRKYLPTIELTEEKKSFNTERYNRQQNSETRLPSTNNRLSIGPSFRKVFTERFRKPG